MACALTYWHPVQDFTLLQTFSHRTPCESTDSPMLSVLHVASFRFTSYDTDEVHTLRHVVRKQYRQFSTVLLKVNQVPRHDFHRLSPIESLQDSVGSNSRKTNEFARIYSTARWQKKCAETRPDNGRASRASHDGPNSSSIATILCPFRKIIGAFLSSHFFCSHFR